MDAWTEFWSYDIPMASEEFDFEPCGEFGY
jgi:hypothetical protein